MKHVLARIAGLPAAALFSSGAGGGTLRCAARSLTEAERELAAATSDLVARLHDEVPTSSPRHRRFLLTLRRDVHNVRPLRRHCDAPGWRELGDEVRRAASTVIALQERVERLRSELERVHRKESEQELAHLLSLLSSPGFRRGLTLASPDLAAACGRLALGQMPRDGARRDRLAESLARYASRAALKLSPFSTLTRVGLGLLVAAPPDTRPLRLLGSVWREVSLVRLRRYVVDQLAEILARHPRIRSDAIVHLNQTLEPAAPGRFRLIPPPGWRPGHRSELRFRPLAPIEIPLGPDLVAWLRRRLALGSMRFTDLASALSEALGGEQSARSHLGKLIDLGVLLTELPWSGSTGHLEKNLAAALLELSSEPSLAAMAESLERLSEVETSFAAAEDPLGAAREIQERLTLAFSAALPAAGLNPDHAPRRLKPTELYEDVFLVHPELPAVVQLSQQTLCELLATLAPWYRLADCFAPRHELLRTVAALVQSRGGEAGALELFHQLGPFWDTYRIRSRQQAGPPGRRAPFNPLGLPVIEQLDRLRASVWAELERLFGEAGDDGAISPEALTEIAALLPAELTPWVGPCAFLQPADPRGDLWVLNRLFEGSGRYSSRYTLTMPEALSRAITAHLRARSHLEAAGETAELLDVTAISGDTLDLHAPQTESVLQLGASAPAGCRAVSPGELRVDLDPQTGLPSVRDGHRRRLLPVFLGGAALGFSPSLIHFLAELGVGEVRPLAPPRRRRDGLGGLSVLARLQIGRVVVARRRFLVPAGPLRERLARLRPASAFAEIDLWRSAVGLPQRVFAIEKVAHRANDDVFKPQYIDFSSPTLCRIFTDLLEGAGERLVLEEALPSPEDLVPDEQGGRWAVEIQADSLALAAAPSWAASVPEPLLWRATAAGA